MLKARYFINDEFLNSYRGFDPSYSWRKIWAAKSLLLEGLRWRVGNGMRIKGWGDAWWRGEGVNLRPTSIATADPELVVADLIDHELGWWNASSRSMH